MFCLLGSSVAFADAPALAIEAIEPPGVRGEFSTRALLAFELPRLVLAFERSARHRPSILDNPFMVALFKGVRVPPLNELAPEERILMVAVRPRGLGGLLRFRVRFDSNLLRRHRDGPLRRFIRSRPLLRTL